MESALTNLATGQSRTVAVGKVNKLAKFPISDPSLLTTRSMYTGSGSVVTMVTSSLQEKEREGRESERKSERKWR